MEWLGKLKNSGSPLARDVESGEFDNVAAFCDRVYRKGTSIALGLIDKAVKRAFDDEVTYATLNYDTLLLQALLGVYNGVGRSCFADLASTSTAKVASNMPAQTLRSTATAFASHQTVRLLNLHGSVQFWRARTASGGTDPLIRPLVIFGNQRDKSVLAQEPPFKVAYDRLKLELDAATGILVVGYGFGDEVLNSAIRDALCGSESLKNALVVTDGDRLSCKVVGEVFGDAEDAWPPILRTRVASLGESDEWKAFVEAFKAES